MEQTVTTSTTKGIVIALILIIIGLIAYFVGIDTTSYFRYINFLILIGGVIWSITSFGKQIDYNSTFGNYFAHGFKVSAIITIIMIIYLVIVVNVFPDIKERGLEAARKGMQKNKDLTQEQINQGLEMTKKFFIVGIIAATMLGYLIFGALASLIGAGITKKNPRPIEIDQ